MKKSIYSCATLMVVVVGALSPSLKAGVSSPVGSQVCKDCSDTDCSCISDCGCAADSHDFFPHAPIGVMGDHIHRKGGLMASYRYMMMRMQRNYDGDSRIGDAAALNDYMMAPTDMDMQMHMLGVMYAPTDKLTLMLMTNYLENEMGMINRAGVKSSMRSSGWGDTTLSGYYSLYQKAQSSAHFGLGLSAPTGSIDETLAGGVHQPYPMQLGSGTWDLKPSLTWLGRSGDSDWSYGSQASAVIHLGENDHGYSLGDSASLTGWISRRLSAWSAVSLRLTGTTWGDVEGRDIMMPTVPMGAMMGQPMAASADPDVRAGSRVDLSVGLNLWSTENGARVAIEAGAPVYQNLDGPQLGTDWFASVGIQFAW